MCSEQPLAASRVTGPGRVGQVAVVDAVDRQ